ncbi:MAG: hypothetical protein M1840_000813 [Geoglossum simile]|nr:MAG: hypothetical protein M1840_000813 [Geoglossum simile]
MDGIRENDVNWNDAAALEYLGPPGYNRERQGDIQDILHNLGTITGRGIPFPPLDWSVHVRCDDWLSDCSGANGKTNAYATNESPDNIATINFCAGYFRYPSLRTAVRRGRSSSDLTFKHNLNNYDRTTGVIYTDNLRLKTSQGYIIVHELLHINWVHKSGRYGHNRQVIDFRIEFWDQNEGRYKVRDVYGPEKAKILARYNRPGTLGDFIARSDENLGLYALAKYVQSQIGAYPHLPLVDSEPRGRPWYTLSNSLFSFNATGGVIANSSAPDDGTLLADYVPKDDSSIIIDGFIPDSDLPADYLAAWKDWSLDGVGSTNLHINNYNTGWIRISAVTEGSGTKDVPVKKGDTVGVLDGWVTYWTSECPGQTATLLWEETYGDVFLEADGYMHDTAGKVF